MPTPHDGSAPSVARPITRCWHLFLKQSIQNVFRLKIWCFVWKFSFAQGSDFWLSGWSGTPDNNTVIYTGSRTRYFGWNKMKWRRATEAPFQVLSLALWQNSLDPYPESERCFLTEATTDDVMLLSPCITVILQSAYARGKKLPIYYGQRMNSFYSHLHFSLIVFDT